MRSPRHLPGHIRTRGAVLGRCSPRLPQTPAGVGRVDEWGAAFGAPDHPRGCCRRLCWVGTVGSPFPVPPGCCHTPLPSVLPHIFHPVEEIFPGLEFVSLCFHPSWPCSVPRGRAGIRLGRCFRGNAGMAGPGMMEMPELCDSIRSPWAAGKGCQPRLTVGELRHRQPGYPVG